MTGVDYREGKDGYYLLLVKPLHHTQSIFQSSLRGEAQVAPTVMYSAVAILTNMKTNTHTYHTHPITSATLTRQAMQHLIWKSL